MPSLFYEEYFPLLLSLIFLAFITFLSCYRLQINYFYENTLYPFWLENKLEVLIISLFASILGRVLLSLGFLEYRSFFTFLVFFVIFGYFRNYLVPKVLNNFIVQLCLYFSFTLEDLVKTNFFILFLAYYSITLFFFMSSSIYTIDSLLFNLSLVFYIFQTYGKTKELLFNPEINTSFEGLDKKENLTWDKIIVAMSSMAIKRYGLPIENCLPGILRNKAFPNACSPYMLSKRSVSEKAGAEAAFSAAKRFAAYAVGAAGVVGTGSQLAQPYVELYNANKERQKDRDLQLQIERLRIESAERIAQARIEVDRAKALANANKSVGGNANSALEEPLFSFSPFFDIVSTLF